MRRLKAQTQAKIDRKLKEKGMQNDGRKTPNTNETDRSCLEGHESGDDGRNPSHAASSGSDARRKADPVSGAFNLIRKREMSSVAKQTNKRKVPYWTYGDRRVCPQCSHCLNRRKRNVTLQARKC